jgi:hypothetical protein
MLDYIASAEEDYLANPRFWGAFIVAGDGAVRPLDGIAESASLNDAIGLEWERQTPEPTDLQIFGIARSRAETFYSNGIEGPLPNEKVGGSYLARIFSNGTVEILERDRDLAASASGIVAIGNDIGVLGYVPKGKQSSAIFRLLDENGQRRWEHVEEGPSWNFPVSVVKAPIGYILVSIETDFSKGTLVATLVSDHGETLVQRRYALSIRPESYSSKQVALNAAGNLVIAIGGNVPASSSAQGTSIWMNPQTGTKRFCDPPAASEIFEVNARSLDLNTRRTIQNIAIVSLKLQDGRLYAAGSIVPNCQLTKRASFVELGPGYESRTIFESHNVNSLEVRDLQLISGGIVLLAGTTHTFLPTELTIETNKSLDQLKDYLEQLKDYKVDPWDDSIWEKTEDYAAAFVLALNKDGAVLADRVFPDLRDRGISMLAIRAPDRLIAVGNAFGGRGWIVGLRLGDQLMQAAGPLSGSPPESKH